MKPVNNIHPTAVVSKKAEIGNNVTIGPFTIIYDNVVIGVGNPIGPLEIELANLGQLCGMGDIDHLQAVGIDNKCMSICDGHMNHCAGELKLAHLIETR